MSCKDESTKPIEHVTFRVEEEGAACTEVWLNVHLGAGYIPRTVQIMRDTVIVMNRTMTETDLTITDTNLTPNHTYTYKAQLLKGTEIIKTIAPFSVHTMDTTSHNFTWTNYTLGDGSGSSCLYDVAIINDTLAYAVGQIYRNDTLFNAAKWNGRTWELRIFSSIICGSSTSIVSPLRAIIAFNAADIWFSDGGEMIHLYEYGYFQDCSMNSLLSGAINKIWGTSGNDLYAAGGSGTIVHYNGTSWTKMESGTTLSINDIYGAYNSTTKQWEIIAVAGDPGSSYDRKILQITGTSASPISDSPILWPLSGVWFVPYKHYYVVGSGIYEKKYFTDNSWLNNPLDITPYYTTRVRGNEINDVLVCGAYGELLHFNGLTWKSYRTEVGLSNGAYSTIAVKNNLVIAVGEDNSHAALAIGRR
jgi:hypothetical protein